MKRRRRHRRRRIKKVNPVVAKQWVDLAISILQFVGLLVATLTLLGLL